MDTRISLYAVGHATSLLIAISYSFIIGLGYKVSLVPFWRLRKSYATYRW